MASATVAGMADDGFRVGNVLNRAGAVFSQIWVPCSLIYVVISLPTVVIGLANSQRGALIGIAGGHSTDGISPMSLGVMFLGGGLLSLLFAVFSKAAVVNASNAAAAGRGAQLGASINAGMGRFFPLLGSWICAGLLIMLASLLFMVPGIILWLSFFAITPICVLEGLGPFATLRRSRELTKGLRWRLFGLLLVLMVLGLIVAALSYAAKLAGSAYAAAAVQLGANALVGVFTTVVSVVAYQDMLAVKEGVGGERIASVFD